MTKSFDFWEDLIFVGKRGSDNKSWNEDHFFVKDLYEAFEGRMLEKIRQLDRIQPKAVPEEECNHIVGQGALLAGSYPAGHKLLMFKDSQQDVVFLDKFNFCPKCGEKLKREE